MIHGKTGRVCLILALLLMTTATAFAQTNTPGPNLMGSGVAMMDYDRDDDLDLFFLTTRDGRVIVYRNDTVGAALSFADVTAEAMGAAVFNANGMAFACGDVDNDGFDDFLVTFGPYPPNSVDTPYRLFRNKGDGSFEEITRRVGLTSYKAGVLTSSAAFFDYDKDGDLDLYIGNYIEMKARDEGDVDLLNAKNHFYENTGLATDGLPRFVDKTDEKGIGWCGGQSEWTLGIATADYDNDGDVDLYVANDYGGTESDDSIRDGDNMLWRNEGDGTFADVTDFSGTRDRGYAMGVDFGDYDNDGHLDIYLANFWEDSVLRNKGDGTFEDVTDQLGIIENLNGWGSAFRDYDNDGDLDILNVNGWIRNGWGQVECEGNGVWENVGTGFVNRVEESGMQDYGDSRGASFGDVNNDGWVDILVQNNTDWAHSEGCTYEAGTHLLLMNQKNRTFQDLSLTTGLRSSGEVLTTAPNAPFLDNNYITFVPRGTISNRSALGTRITITAGGKTQIRELGVGSYMSVNEFGLHFGLGSETMIDEVTIRWPNGLVETMANVPGNQRLQLTEGAVSVQLLSFTAEALEAGVRVRWSFGDPEDHAGFNLHRRADGEPYRVLNSRLITTMDRDVVFEDDSAVSGVRYEYRLEAVDREGRSQWFGPIALDTPAAIRIAGLGQNFPNPLKLSTLIPVTTSRPGPVSVQIFSTDGRLVRTLDANLPGAGLSTLAWDGRDTAGLSVPSGHYFYRLSGADEPARRMTLVK